jgi:hypothetical protein
MLAPCHTREAPALRSNEKGPTRLFPHVSEADLRRCVRNNCRNDFLVVVFGLAMMAFRRPMESLLAPQ